MRGRPAADRDAFFTREELDSARLRHVEAVQAYQAAVQVAMQRPAGKSAPERRWRIGW